jgi:hypothetical protein
MTRDMLLLIVALFIVAGYQPVNSQRTARFAGFDLVDKEENIRKPADYRDRYESLGTYTVIDAKGNQMHN